MKPIACLRIPNYAWQIEAERSPELRKCPIIITGKIFDLPNELTNTRNNSSISSPSARFVFETSPDLTDVMSGMPLTEATANHHDALVIEADTTFYDLVFEEIIERLKHLIPDIEVAGPGLVYIGIWGVQKLYGDDAHVVRLLANAVNRFDLRIGVGDNKWMAYAASLLSRANSARKVTGDPGQFLDKFPVDSLPVPFPLIRKLHAFGLKTMGHIADIQRGPMEAQFGQIGGIAWELSNGIDNRPLIPKQSVLEVSEYLDFPSPTTNITTIFLAVENLLDRAYKRTVLSDRFARQANIHSQVSRHTPWTIQIAFKDPANNKNKALFAIKSKLGTVSFPGPLEDMHLTLSGITGEVGRQESMWRDVKRGYDLQETFKQLNRRLKVTPPIYQVRELEPWSRIPERRYALVQLNTKNDDKESHYENTYSKTSIAGL